MSLLAPWRTSSLVAFGSLFDPTQIGVDQADISRVERGVVGPTSRTLLRLVEALDAEVQIVERISA